MTLAEVFEAFAGSAYEQEGAYDNPEEMLDEVFQIQGVVDQMRAAGNSSYVEALEQMLQDSYSLPAGHPDLAAAAIGNIVKMAHIDDHVTDPSKQFTDHYHDHFRVNRPSKMQRRGLEQEFDDDMDNIDDREILRGVHLQRSSDFDDEVEGPFRRDDRNEIGFSLRSSSGSGAGRKRLRGSQRYDSPSLGLDQAAGGFLERKSDQESGVFTAEQRLPRNRPSLIKMSGKNERRRGARHRSR